MLLAVEHRALEMWLLFVSNYHLQGFQLVPKMSKGEEMTLLLENGQTIPLYVSYCLTFVL